MKIEDIIIGEEYFVDLNHKNAYSAFEGDVACDKYHVVKVKSVSKSESEEGLFDIEVTMENIAYHQIIEIECFIKPL